MQHFIDEDPIKADLVEQVKEWQRKSEGHKQAWYTFVRTIGSSHFDPKRHDASQLESFLSQAQADDLLQSIDLGGTNSSYATPRNSTSVGEWKAWGAEPSEDLVKQVKEWQRRGDAHKQAWYAFCKSQGSKHYDPSKHDDSALQAFLESVENGSADIHVREAEEAHQGNPNWRGESKESMVMRIKKWQKMSEKHKESWYSFVRSFGNSNYDPNRHEEQTLSTFLAAADSGELGLPGKGGGGKGDYGKGYGKGSYGKFDYGKGGGDKGYGKGGDKGGKGGMVWVTQEMMDMWSSIKGGGGYNSGWQDKGKAPYKGKGKW